MLALLHSAIDRGEDEKYLFLPLYGNTEKFTRDSAHPQDRLVAVKKRKSDYASCSVLSNNLQNDLSKRICNHCSY